MLDTPLLQILYLVFHQGYQGGNHQAHSFFSKCRDLEVMDLPPPVGISPKVSLFLLMLSMISSWIPRKRSYPQYCFRIRELRVESWEASGCEDMVAKLKDKKGV